MKEILYKILFKLKLTKALNFTVSINLNNKKFIIPIIYGLGAEHIQISEPWMVQLLKKIIPITEGTFFDVGVNTGQTILKLNAVKPNANYIGFEPNPKCVFYVDELIAVNKIQNTKLLPVGLMLENGLLQLNFYSESNTDQAASLVQDFRPEQKVVAQKYIAAMNWNSLNIKNEKIGILKIDVEGAELFVIESILDKIKTDSPIIMMEILPAYTISNLERIERQEKLQNILIQNGYQFYRVLKSDVVSLQKVNNIEIHSDMEMCEYVIVPKNVISKIETEFLISK